MGITDFFTPEAGQRRTQALNSMEQQLGDALAYYLGPTGIPQRLGAAAQIGAILSPGSDMVDAMNGSGQIMQAKSPVEAAAGAATMAGGLGSMFLPGTFSGLRQGFDGMVDAGMRAHNGGALFALPPGAMR